MGAVIDRCIKCLLMVRGVKSMSSGQASTALLAISGRPEIIVV